MIGKTISHYKILEKLGGGGMGVVYKAKDTKLKRTVALKFLPHDLTRNKTAKKRFIREAQNASTLDHPNISNIHEIDETSDGQLFICMSYYEGETLQGKIERGPLQIEQAVAIAMQVAQGLFKAHSKGIIHRDIKPANIFITNDGQVKILDFGLAKLAGETKITKDGTTTGTIAYMSPEQAQGKDVDKRTDIWSLGVVLYEMLTGKLPFKGENWRVTLYAILSTQPESIRQVRDDIPEALELTVERMMQKDTNARYADTTTLITDLNTVARESGFALPQIVTRDASKRHKLVRILTPSLVLALLVIIFLLLRSVFFPTPAYQRDNIAVMHFKNLTGESSLDYLSEAIPNLLITSLEQSEYLDVMTRERMYDLLKKTGEVDVGIIDETLGFELCRMEGIETIVLGSFTKAGDIFATDAKILDVKTKKLLKSASSRGEGIASIINNQIDELSTNISIGIGVPEEIVQRQTQIADVTTSSMEAYTYYLEGREYQVRGYREDARQSFEKAVELDSTFASAYLHLAWAYGDLLDAAAANEAYEKAKKYAEKATEKERLYIEASYAVAIKDNTEEQLYILKRMVEKYPNEKRVHNSLGWYYSRRSWFDEAIEAFNRALKLDPQYGPAMYGLGYTYAYMKEFDTALEYYKKYASLFPDDANSYEAMGEIHYYMGNLDQAIVAFEKALEIRPVHLIVVMYLYFIHALREDYAEALKWTDYYIEMAPSPGIRGAGHSMKAYLAYWLGDEEQWDYHYRRTNELYAATGYSWGVHGMDLISGAMHYELRDYEKSRMLIENSLDSFNIYEPSFAPWRTGFFNFCLGMVDVREGKLQSARSRLSVIKSLQSKVWESGIDWLRYRHDLLYAEILLTTDSLDKVIDLCENMLPCEDPELNLPGIICSNLTLPDDVLARAYLKKGELDKAIAEYEQLITVDVKSGEWHLVNPRYHYRLAQLYDQRELYPQAIAEYQKFIDILKETDMHINEINKAKGRLTQLSKEQT